MIPQHGALCLGSCLWATETAQWRMCWICCSSCFFTGTALNFNLCDFCDIHSVSFMSTVSVLVQLCMCLRFTQVGFGEQRCTHVRLWSALSQFASFQHLCLISVSFSINLIFPTH